MSKFVKISIIVVLLALLAVGGWFTYRYFSVDGQGTGGTTSTSSGTPIDINSGEKLDLATWKDLAGSDKVIDSGSFIKPEGIITELSGSEKEIADKAVVQQTSRYFVEVFGSYSSDNNFQNLKDLKPLMTTTYWAKWEKDLKTITERPAYSIWSQALNANVDSFSGTSATATVLCKRGERTDKNAKENIFYQSAKVNLVKVNDNWLVDKVVWLE
jgi:hypothetical protein